MQERGSLPPDPARRTRRTLTVEPGVELSIVEVRGPAAGPTLGVVAGVHGDEVECIAALEDWLDDLRLDAGRVLAVPVAHPAALAAGTRLGPDGVDLNRVAPGDAGADEPTLRLASALTQLLAGAADVVVTLHSWSRSGETVPYVEFPARPTAAVGGRARELAHALGLPWAEPWEWPEGLVPAALCRAGVPAVEVEVGGLGRTTPEGHAVARSALDAAVVHMGLRGADAQAATAATTTVDRSWIEATAGGRVRHLVALGEAIRQQQPVAEIRGADGSVVATLRSETAGIVAVHVTYGVVSAGDPVAVVFAPHAVAASPR